MVKKLVFKKLFYLEIARSQSFKRGIVVTGLALEPSGRPTVSSVGARRLPIGRKLPRALAL